MSGARLTEGSGVKKDPSKLPERVINTHIPISPKEDRFGSLIVSPLKRLSYGKDRNYAKELSFFKAPNFYSTFQEFHRLLTWNEVYKSNENFLVNPDPVEVMFHTPKGQKYTFVYKKYVRQNQMVAVDQFLRRLHYIRFCKDLIEHAPFEELNDLLSVIGPLQQERDRRLELQFQFGRGFRPQKRTARVEPTMGTYRAQFARYLRKSPQLWPEQLVSRVDEIRKHIQTRMNALNNAVSNKDSKIVNSIENSITEFKSLNPDWWKGRLNMKPLPHTLDFPYRRKAIGQFLAHPTPWFRSLSVDDVMNELLEWPTFIGHSLYICRSVKAFKLEVADRSKYTVISDKKKRKPLCILPSRYSNRPITAVVKKVDQEYELSFARPPPYPPSVNSMSGMSTNSTLSTATTTPGSWHHQWKIQTMHRDYEHRIGETSLPNPLQEHIDAQTEYSHRYGHDVERRLNMIHAEKKNLKNIFHTNSKFADYFSTLMSTEKMTLRPEQHFTPWFASIRKQFDTALELGEKKDAEVLLYAVTAMMRIEGAYSELRGQESVHNEYIRRMSINGAWRRLVQGGAFDVESMRMLLLVLSSDHVWVPDPDYSHCGLRPRLDKMSIPVTPSILQSDVWKLRISNFYFVTFIVLIAFFLFVLSSVGY